MKTLYINPKSITLWLAVASAICHVGVSAQEVPDTLGATYADLDELVVTAKKEIVKSDGAKLTYDMQQDDSSKGSTLLDALRKVPLVSVDGNDNILIKGSSNFKVYVNGKEDPMLTANYQKMFKAMPAQSVSKIEVITEPGAKYDAEGTGGILNLVTESKQSKEGYTGNASLTYSAQQYAASLYGRMKQDKVTADANVTYAGNRLQLQENVQKQTLVNENSDQNYKRTSRSDQKFSYNFLNAALNLSWEPNDKNLFSLGGGINLLDANVMQLKMTNQMYSRMGNLLWQTLQDGKGGLGNLGANGNLSYKRILPGDGHSIIAAYCFNFGRNMMDLTYDNQVEAGPVVMDPYQRSYNANYQREHTATIDYEKSFLDGKHTLEAGAKGVFRRNSAVSWLRSGEDADHYTLSTDNGDILQVQDVYAIYAGYNGVFGNVTAGAGLRYEHTYMGLDFPGNSSQNFRSRLNDVVPNASVTYLFTPASNLRLAYQMRIQRPSVSDLNPTPFFVSQTFANVGNPDLESAKRNSLTLTYSNFNFNKVGGTLSLGYWQTNNSIEQYDYVKDGVTYQSSGNFGINRTTRLDGFLSLNPTDRFTASVSGNVGYTAIRAPKQDLENQGWELGYDINLGYRGHGEVHYGLYGGQDTGNVELQGRFNGWYYYGLSIRKDFLKDDSLSVTINASNFFTKWITYSGYNVTDGGRLDYTSRNRSWNVGISVSWKFGQLKDQVKKISVRTDNDDVESKSSKSGGIGL